MGSPDCMRRLLSVPGARFHHGVSRAVAVVGEMAFKVAFDERGARCNRFEQHVWNLFGAHERRGQHLCPVLWSDARGRVLIMPSAVPLLPNQVRKMRRHAPTWWEYDYCGPSFPWEHKPEDWGLFEGRIVAVDYAEPALFPLMPFEAMKWGFEG